MRAILLVIDGFGVGALPDAERYGDSGANTAHHICQTFPGDKWPCLQRLGLGNCTNILGYSLPGCKPAKTPLASYGVMREMSPGKDTMTGHWELAGITLRQPFQTFDQHHPSFPDALVRDFEKQTGHKMLGNKGASGTRIIEDLGKDHMDGAGIIVYTSADSVLQIAAHEAIIPVKDLYHICEIARKLCEPFNVGRVIARPFKGTPGNFIRTGSRKDFSMVPTERTILDHFQKAGIQTIGIGKIGDIFSERGISTSYHDTGNDACMARTISCLKEKRMTDQFLFVNLVDTDMLYGHRRDIQGYHDAVQKVDAALDELIHCLSDENLLIITSDHGCDPGFKGTDHTREYVPLLVIHRHKPVQNLGIRDSFCDVSQSLSSFFNLEPWVRGTSFL